MSYDLAIPVHCVAMFALISEISGVSEIQRVMNWDG